MIGVTLGFEDQAIWDDKAWSQNVHVQVHFVTFT